MSQNKLFTLELVVYLVELLGVPWFLSKSVEYKASFQKSVIKLTQEFDHKV